MHILLHLLIGSMIYPCNIHIFIHIYIYTCLCAYLFIRVSALLYMYSQCACICKYCIYTHICRSLPNLLFPRGRSLPGDPYGNPNHNVGSRALALPTIPT